MEEIIVHQEKIINHEELTELCPFDAIEVVERAVSPEDRNSAESKGNYAYSKEIVINENCKVCKLCVKNGPEGVFEFVETLIASIDKRQWKGVAVYVDHEDGKIHPVTYELIGKAREMAEKIDHPVYCVFMAHIHTPNHRPQFATVRYKIFSAPECLEESSGKITPCKIAKRKLASKIKVLEVKRKEKVEAIEEAEVIVAVGRGLQKEEDLEMIYKLAKLLGAQVGCTRPLIETGWVDPRNQIGLSGRTVKPKLIISCGISGAIQWAAGMNNSDCIVAINTDDKAPIFEIADYAIVGDIYEVIPKLLDKLTAYEGYESSVECRI